MIYILYVCVCVCIHTLCIYHVQIYRYPSVKGTDQLIKFLAMNLRIQQRLGHKRAELTIGSFRR